MIDPFELLCHNSILPRNCYYGLFFISATSLYNAPKKLITVILLSAVFFNIYSCAEKQSVLNDTETSAVVMTTEETADINFTADLPAVNYGGKIFTFLVQDDPSFRHLYDVNTNEVNGDNINGYYSAEEK